MTAQRSISLLSNMRTPTPPQQVINQSSAIYPYNQSVTTIQQPTTVENSEGFWQPIPISHQGYNRIRYDEQTMKNSNNKLHQQQHRQSQQQQQLQLQQQHLQQQQLQQQYRQQMQQHGSQADLRLRSKPDRSWRNDERVGHNQQDYHLPRSSKSHDGYHTSTKKALSIKTSKSQPAPVTRIVEKTPIEKNFFVLQQPQFPHQGERNSPSHRNRVHYIHSHSVPCDTGNVPSGEQRAHGYEMNGAHVYYDVPNKGHHQAFPHQQVRRTNSNRKIEQPVFKSNNVHLKQQPFQENFPVQDLIFHKRDVGRPPLGPRAKENNLTRSTEYQKRTSLSKSANTDQNNNTVSLHYPGLAKRPSMLSLATSTNNDPEIFTRRRERTPSMSFGDDFRVSSEQKFDTVDSFKLKKDTGGVNRWSMIKPSEDEVYMPFPTNDQLNIIMAPPTNTQRTILKKSKSVGNDQDVYRNPTNTARKRVTIQEKRLSAQSIIG